MFHSIKIFNNKYILLPYNNSSNEDLPVGSLLKFNNITAIVTNVLPGTLIQAKEISYNEFCFRILPK